MIGQDIASALSALETAQNTYDKTLVSDSTWVQPWTPELVQFLTLGVLGFSLIVLFMATALLWRNGASAHQILRVFGVISILGFSALLLVVGYNNEQLTPIVGLFGAIAGYLLGRESRGTSENQ